MPDWTSSMQQTFEYYIVDPGTWRDRELLTNVISCSITRDSSAETLGSATFTVIGTIDECYVRVYLVTIQNGVRERFPLGTFLAQTPSSNYTGAYKSTTVDAYTPLIELKENQPPLGYSLLEGDIIMQRASQLTAENVRAPVISSDNTQALEYDFVSDIGDTWLSFITDLIANAKFYFDLDEMSRIIFMPKQDTASLQPVWIYNDDNSSILYPSVSVERDLYGIPNVVEVVYSTGNGYYVSRVENNDESSPISIPNRGRQIVYRDSAPSLIGTPTNIQIDDYAQQLLRELSTLEFTITYSHGYCPVRIGDCVMLNYERAGIRNVKAKVTNQTLNCSTGMSISETAVFTNKLWEG